MTTAGAAKRSKKKVKSSRYKKWSAVLCTACAASSLQRFAMAGLRGGQPLTVLGDIKGAVLTERIAPFESPREARQSITVFAVRIYCNYHAQRRALAQEVCAAYTEKLKADPSYRKVLYRELADYWHRNNRKNRGKLEPLNYFDKPYKLRGKNREKALKLGYPTEYDRLALRATSVFHLAHWRDDVSIASYVTAR